MISAVMMTSINSISLFSLIDTPLPDPLLRGEGTLIQSVALGVQFLPLLGEG